MCGRFSQYSPVSDLVSQFAIDETVVDDDRRPRYNVAPTQDALVVAASADGEVRKLGPMRWGFVPRWADDPSIGSRMINARTDKVASSNAFRSAWTRRRCLVPVDGFFEWAKPTGLPLTGPGHTGPGHTGPGLTGPAPTGQASIAKPAKTPFHIHRPDGTPLGLAGLWETWYDAEDRPLRSFTILTCDANPTMAAIHHRMPVVVDPADWDRWLRPGPLDHDDHERLLAPPPDDLLEFDEVSTSVNRPVNDTAEVIAPV